jgi:8-oxo-dGTP pyrophosphatase MutT (NUDIX family)
MEKSCGLIIFRKEKTLEFLLLKSHSEWCFPKGHVEPNESELQTALRETTEETSLANLTILPSFRELLTYQYLREGKTVSKKCIYFLAIFNEGSIKISKEHLDYGWFSLDEALVKLHHENAKNLLIAANSFIVKTHSN